MQHASGPVAHKIANKRRDLFLDLAQCRRLLDVATRAVCDLIEAVIKTGARAGELTGLTWRTFDAPTKAASFAGKTGPMTVPLNTDALALFKRLKKGKAPGD